MTGRLKRFFRKPGPHLERETIEIKKTANDELFDLSIPMLERINNVFKDRETDGRRWDYILTGDFFCGPVLGIYKKHMGTLNPKLMMPN